MPKMPSREFGVTTTTSSATASRCASKIAPSPLAPPPPCSHTMTGLEPPVRGAVTLRNRQSSSRLAMSAKSCGSCGQGLPGSVASRTCGHGSTGCGEHHRRSPTGGAAYGIPWNSRYFS